MLTKVPKCSTVFIIVGHHKSFYHFGNVELFRCLSSNKFLVDNLSEMYETHKRAEIPEPPGMNSGTDWNACVDSTEYYCTTF
jgi:hypothetical protein